MMSWSREDELDRGREDTAQTCISLIPETQKLFNYSDTSLC